MKYFITSRNPSKLYCLVKGCSTEVNSLSHTIACRCASEGCLARYLAWRSMFIRRLLAVGHPSSSILNNKHSIPKKHKQTHKKWRFREAEKLSCLDIPAGAKEVSAIKIIAAFEKLKSFFEELQLIFGISQSDFQKNKTLIFVIEFPFQIKSHTC